MLRKIEASYNLKLYTKLKPVEDLSSINIHLAGVSMGMAWLKIKFL